VPSDGQEGGDEQEGKAQGRGPGEGSAEGVEQDAGGAGQPVVQVAPFSSDGPCLAGLPLPAFASLGLGKSPPLAYAGHQSLPVRSQELLRYPYAVGAALVATARRRSLPVLFRGLPPNCKQSFGGLFRSPRLLLDLS
jgi:hypothetical protein